jgi:hypothetical protein
MKASPALQLVMTPTERSRESILDEYGELDRQVRAFAPTKKRHEVLRTQILDMEPGLHAEQFITLSGSIYDVTISERENESHVLNMAKLYKAMTRETFLGVCKITVKVIEAALGESAAALHLVKKRTGPRHLLAVPKLSPAIPAKAA